MTSHDKLYIYTSIYEYGNIPDVNLDVDSTHFVCCIAGRGGWVPHDRVISTCAMGARDRGKAAIRPSRSSPLFSSGYFWFCITVSFATGWIGCCLWCMTIVCSLDRFCAGYNHCLFLHLVWRWYTTSACLFQFLTPAEQHRLARAHIVIRVERQEVALAATARSLGILHQVSSFSVPTPPLAVWD